jgi:peptidoglycan/xylan/chitin deacetylase (PgdA/CDA1 family)
MKSNKAAKLLIIMLMITAVSITAAVFCLQYFDYTLTIKLNGRPNITLEYGEPYMEEGADAVYTGHVLNQKGKAVEVAVSGDVDTAVTGTYKLTYAAAYKDQTVSVQRTVTVVDTTAPELTLAGEKTVELEMGQEYAEPGYTAVDEYEGDLTAQTVISGEPDVSVPGTYTVTYSVSDSAGNEASVERTVHIMDVNPPEIVLSGSSTVYVALGSSFVDPGYSAYDLWDGDLTDQVQISGSVDTGTRGAYGITYTVEDSSGNTASAGRTVRVYPPTQQDPVNTGSKIIYLTFDDGPGAYTENLLEVLDRYNVKATFFVTNNAPDYQYLIGEEAARGHTVGIHSYSHDYSKIYTSKDAYMADLWAMNDIITAQTGSGASFLRFPGGSSNTVSKKYCKGIMTALASEVEADGFRYCDWNVLSGDAGDTTSTSKVVANVIAGCSKNDISIVLQHDIKSFSVAAVEEIIQWGLSEGYTFLPMDGSTPMVHQGLNN